MKKILLIDDDPQILESTADFLHVSGFEPITASGGSEGIRKARLIFPDLVICDVMMPEITGLEVYKALQEDISTSDIPFIFLSALSEKSDVRRVTELGAEDYIIKPFDPEELLKTIEARIEKFDRLIKQKELRYHILFELASDAILMIRYDTGEIVDSNRAGYEMLGYGKEEIVKLNARNLFPDNEWVNVFRVLDTMNQCDPVKFSDIHLKNQNRKDLPVLLSGQVLEIHGTKYILFIAHDMSEIKGKEIALKESEERNRDLVENIGEGIGVVDPNERFTYVNPAASEIFGLPADKLIGQKLLNFIHPSSHAEILKQSQNRKLGLKNIYEVEVLRLDGQRRWIIVTATPQYDASGQFAGTFGIFRDISSSKISEAKIKESEERLRAIVNLTNDYIWEIDPQWKYTYLSSRVYDILGYRPEELTGKSIFDFMLPEDADKYRESLREIVLQYKPLNLLTYRTLHRDGHIVYLESNGIALFDNKEKYIGYRGADRDITIRKSFENQLITAKDKAEESDRLKSSILANVSHELRTPLNGILGFAEILKKEMKETDLAMMAENIHSSGERLMSTLNSLISLSQLVAGKISINYQAIHLNECISSVVRIFETSISEKKLKIKIDADPEISLVTDEALFKQLFRQILDNAVKFTEKGGITISVSVPADKKTGFVRISVRDTGIGIDKLYHDMIFHEFRQVSEGFGRKYQGSGIGLTICKKIIDMLEGYIDLDSIAGAGSTFNIHLPYREAPEIIMNLEAEKSSGKEVKAEKASELPWILLVEDNLVNKELTEFFLRKLCKVDYAPDGTSAIQKARMKKYRAVLMDINLGAGINGVETTKEIRKISGYKNVPIIAVTGYTLSGDRDMLLSQGCTHYLAKPFDQASIIELMKKVFSEYPG